MLSEMRAERNSCARNITLDWIGMARSSSSQINYAKDRRLAGRCKIASAAYRLKQLVF